MHVKEPFVAKWNVLDIFLIFILPMAFLAPLEMLLNSLGISAEYNYLIIYSAQPISTLLMVFFLLKYKYRYNLFQHKFITINRKRILLIIVLMSLLIWGLATTANILFQNTAKQLFNASPQPQNVTLFFFDKIRGSLLFYFASIIVFWVPIAEEVFFRGILHSFLRNNINVLKGTFLASAFFSLAHFEVWVFFPTFLAGLGFSYLFEKFKSLWAPVIAHMVWNGMGFIMMVIRIYSM